MRSHKKQHCTTEKDCSYLCHNYICLSLFYFYLLPISRSCCSSIFDFVFERSFCIFEPSRWRLSFAIHHTQFSDDIGQHLQSYSIKYPTKGMQPSMRSSGRGYVYLCSFNHSLPLSILSEIQSHFPSLK